jgi:hypothetical protein
MNWLRRLFGLSPTPHAAALARVDSTNHTTGVSVSMGTPATTPQTAAPLYDPKDPLLHIGRGVGGFELEIVGESHYQDTLSNLRDDNDNGAKWIKSDFHILPEPTNPYDPDAIRVATTSGETVGYFSRRDAQRYKSCVARGLEHWGTLWCRGLFVGGSGDKESIGVRLDVLPPRDLIALLKSKQEVKALPSRRKRKLADTTADGQLDAALNATRRAERDVSEVIGLLKGFLIDDVITDQEVQFLSNWGDTHADALGRWPLSVLFERIRAATADDVISGEERAQLRAVFLSIVGGTVTVHLGGQGASDLPLDVPPPPIAWPDSVFVFTGQFAYGTRAGCSAEVRSRGGRVELNVTKRTSYLVVGSFGRRDWVQSSYGRKIERAIELRQDGSRIHIVGEDHWANSLTLPTTPVS